MEDDNTGRNSYEIIEGSIFEYQSSVELPPPGSPLERFGRLAALPDEEMELAEAALILSALEYPGLNEAYYLDQLDVLADEVRPLIATETDPLKNIEHLNYFLTTLKGFHGNEADYNNRRNSFLNDILERRTGIPITLSLLYIELGNRLGLHFEGVGLPGHFIIRYRELAPQALSSGDRFESDYDSLERYREMERSRDNLSSDILLDPFTGGTILTEEDCVELVRERYGRAVPIRHVLAHSVTNRQFLTRMLNNLKVICITEQDFERALQIQECLVLLNPRGPEEKRDRGVIYARQGRFGRAISDLQTYLRENPAAPDANVIRRQLTRSFDQMVKRN